MFRFLCSIGRNSSKFYGLGLAEFLSFSLIITNKPFPFKKNHTSFIKVSPDHHLSPYLNPQIPKLKFKANILEIFFEYLCLLLVIFAMDVSKSIINNYLAKNNYYNYRFIPKHHSRQYFLPYKDNIYGILPILLF